MMGRTVFGAAGASPPRPDGAFVKEKFPGVRVNGGSMRTTRWNRSMRGCTALAALLVAAVAGAAGCGAAGGVSPSASVNTAVQGWEHYFRLEWAPRPTASGTLIDGYVHNTYGSSMSNVRLLAQALDANRRLFRETHIPYSYDPDEVARDHGIPLHPGAEQYYRERGYRT